MHAPLHFAQFAKSLYWSAWLFWKDLTNRWLLAILAVLTGIALLAGTTAFAKRKATIDAADELAAFNRRLQLSEFSEEADFEKIVGRKLTKEEQGKAKTQRIIAKLPTSLAYSGGNFNALLPPSTWLILGLGVSDQWPDRYRITAHSRRQNLEREDIASPYQLAYGPWDVSTVVVNLLPLVIIALTFNLMSAEREQGLLTLLLVNAGSYRQWIIANALLRSGLAIITVLGIALPFAIYSGMSRGVLETTMRAVAFGSIVIGYGFFWMAVALLVNSGGGTSLMNGLILMGLWLCAVCLVPASVSRVATLLQPVLSKDELITVERALRETAEKNGVMLLDDYYAQHPEVVRPTRAEDPYGQTRWDAIRLDVDRSFQPFLDQQTTQLQNRLWISQLGMTLSPALAAKFALDDLCGASLLHYLDFLRRSSEFDATFKDFFQPRMMSRGQLTLADFEAMPAFQHRSLSWMPHYPLLAGSFIVIVAWTCVVFAIAWFRLRNVVI